MSDCAENVAPKRTWKTTWLRQRTALLWPFPRSLDARPVLWTLVVLVVIGVATGLWQHLSQPTWMTVRVNGVPVETYTRARTVGAWLAEQGIVLHPQDVLYPPPDTPLEPNMDIALRLARRVVLVADGERRVVYTHAKTVEDLLREAGITLGPEDALRLNGQPAQLDTPLPRLEQADRRARGVLQVQRAVPITVDDDGVVMTVYTREETLGTALLAEGIRLFEGDQVRPELSTRVAPHLRVTIRRSKPATFRFDGQVVRTRTRARTVGEALAELGVEVRPLDRVEPSLDAPVTDNVEVRVVRVDHEIVVETEEIPFERQLVPDPNLELDTFEVRVPGEPGIRKREILVVYEDGKETQRTVQREWVEKEPVDRMVAYGTKVVVRTLQTPDGPVEYWRHFRMLATSYTAATSGKSRDHPLYGITRTGVPAGYGVVAVDPRVVRLWSRVYVPDYGIACACDTGGAIRGMRIDLGYDEDNLKLWYRWVDVYVLTPVPPSDQIRYIVPGMPIP